MTRKLQYPPLTDSATRLLLVIVEVSRLDKERLLYCTKSSMRYKPLLMWQIGSGENVQMVGEVSDGGMKELEQLGYVSKQDEIHYFVNDTACARADYEKKTKFQKTLFHAKMMALAVLKSIPGAITFIILVVVGLIEVIANLSTIVQFISDIPENLRQALSRLIP